jgi:plastocyanin
MIHDDLEGKRSTTILRARTVKAMLAPLTVAIVFLALVPAGASGAADVIRNLGNSFDRSTYYMDQGDLVQYQYVGAGAPHNVRSTQFSAGNRLFSSDTISTGTTPVDGTQYLAPGTYPFICTIHPSQMVADLVVRKDSTPPPDGGGGPLILDLRAKEQALRKKLTFFATASVASTLVAESKKTKDTETQLIANQKTKIRAKLKRKARTRLDEKLDENGKAKVKVKGTATTQSGAEATDEVKVKLRER